MLMTAFLYWCAGTGGAGAHSGMKAKLQASLPWLFRSCHRLELACKDAFISPLFEELSETFLRLLVILKIP